jgi:hypothetical protein
MESTPCDGRERRDGGHFGEQHLERPPRENAMRKVLCCSNGTYHDVLDERDGAYRPLYTGTRHELAYIRFPRRNAPETHLRDKHNSGPLGREEGFLRAACRPEGSLPSCGGANERGGGTA